MVICVIVFLVIFVVRSRRGVKQINHDTPESMSQRQSAPLTPFNLQISPQGTAFLLKRTNLTEDCLFIDTSISASTKYAGRGGSSFRETTTPEVTTNHEAPRESVGDLFNRLERAGWRVELNSDDNMSSSMPPQYQSVA